MRLILSSSSHVLKYRSRLSLEIEESYKPVGKNEKEKLKILPIHRSNNHANNHDPVIV